MALLSTKIVVPQHIEYLIVDRDLSILEYSPYLSRFFPPHQLLSRGQNLRELLPELLSYKQTLQELFAGTQEYFSLPKINFNSAQDIYFTTHIAAYKSDDSDYNYLIIFLEDIANHGVWA